MTLVDHLYGIHLQVGNFVTIAQRQQLSTDHPLRRFLMPFCYQTISVNDNARNNLINPNSMGPRNFAFTEEGTQVRLDLGPYPRTTVVLHSCPPPSLFARSLVFGSRPGVGSSRGRRRRICCPLGASFAICWVTTRQRTCSISLIVHHAAPRGTCVRE